MSAVLIDPFRFGVAAAVIGASGSYTGNGATDRTISLAFTPKFVVVVNETTNSPMFFSNIDPGTRGFRIPYGVTHPDQSAANATRPSVTTNGFIVSSTVTNASGAVFHYFAFG